MRALDESMLARLMATVPGADLELSFAGEWRAGALCRREAGGSVNFFPARGENYRPGVTATKRTRAAWLHGIAGTAR